MARPEPKYEVASIIVFHYRPTENKEPSLFLIKEKAYKKCTGDCKPRWYYNGNLLELRKTSHPELPLIPVYSTTLTNAPEENLIALEQLLV